MKTRLIIFFTLILTLLISCGDDKSKPAIPEPYTNNIFATIDYDSVIAYSYDGEGGNEIIDAKGRLMSTIVRQVKLSESQIIRYTNSISNKDNYGGDIAACFDPHMGIVFYKDNRPKAYVSICLDCNYLVSSAKIPESESGFSRQGIKEIQSWEVELGFRN